MNRPRNENVTIFIDQKKNRMRIYQHTLHMLGNPQYIQLLINPDDLCLALRPVDKKDKLSHKVNISKATGKRNFELYSTNLIERLSMVCPEWNKNVQYILYGEIIGSENIAMFNLLDAIPISKEHLNVNN